MAYKNKRITIKLPSDITTDITALDLPGSLTDQVIWLLTQAIKAQKNK